MQKGGKQAFPVRCSGDALLPGSVTGNTAEFESVIPGSNPGLVTNVGCSLTGKAPHCECGEQGSSPGVNQHTMRFGVMVTRRSHKPEDAGSNPATATMNDLAQLAVYYPDTVAVDSSMLSVITNWFVTQLDQRTGLLHRELCVRIAPGQQCTTEG